MIVKECSELYSGNIISQEKSWAKLAQAVEDFLDTIDENEEIEILFSGVNITSPWNHMSFMQLLRNKRVHMRFTNQGELVARIKASAILNGGYPDNIINISIEKPKQKTAAELRIESNGEIIKDLFKLVGNRYEWEVKSKYGQIYNSNTMDWIKYGIDKLISESDITEYYLDLANVQLSPVVIQSFADMIILYETTGITITLNITNEEDIKRFNLSMHKAVTQVYTKKERVRAVRKNLVKGNPGLLIKYKKSKAVDEFGRHGKGDVVSCRIAVFRDLKIKDDETVFIVDAYNKDYFYLKYHWMAENDGEQLEKLVKETLEIKMEDIGLLNIYLGASYHFIEPIQQDISENEKVIYGVTERGTNKSKMCTIPERMKLVFDDWGVEYDKERLDEYIRLTNERLAEVTGTAGETTGQTEGQA